MAHHTLLSVTLANHHVKCSVVGASYSDTGIGPVWTLHRQHGGLVINTVALHFQGEVLIPASGSVCKKFACFFSPCLVGFLLVLWYFLPQSKDMRIKLMCVSKSPVVCECECKCWLRPTTVVKMGINTVVTRGFQWSLLASEAPVWTSEVYGRIDFSNQMTYFYCTKVDSSFP